MNIKNLLLSVAIATTIMQPAMAQQEAAPVAKVTKKEAGIRIAKTVFYLAEFGASLAVGTALHQMVKFSPDRDTKLVLSPVALVTAAALTQSIHGLYKEVAKPFHKEVIKPAYQAAKAKYKKYKNS